MAGQFEKYLVRTPNGAPAAGLNDKDIINIAKKQRLVDTKTGEPINTGGVDDGGAVPANLTPKQVKGALRKDYKMRGKQGREQAKAQKLAELRKTQLALPTTMRLNPVTGEGYDSEESSPVGFRISEIKRRKFPTRGYAESAAKGIKNPISAEEFAAGQKAEFDNPNSEKNLLATTSLRLYDNKVIDIDEGIDASGKRMKIGQPVEPLVSREIPSTTKPEEMITTVIPEGKTVSTKTDIKSGARPNTPQGGETDFEDRTDYQEGIKEQTASEKEADEYDENLRKSGQADFKRQQEDIGKRNPVPKTDAYDKDGNLKKDYDRLDQIPSGPLSKQLRAYAALTTTIKNVNTAPRRFYETDWNEDVIKGSKEHNEPDEYYIEGIDKEGNLDPKYDISKMGTPKRNKLIKKGKNIGTYPKGQEFSYKMTPEEHIRALSTTTMREQKVDSEYTIVEGDNEPGNYRSDDFIKKPQRVLPEEKRSAIPASALFPDYNDVDVATETEEDKKSRRNLTQKTKTTELDISKMPKRAIKKPTAEQVLAMDAKAARRNAQLDAKGQKRTPHSKGVTKYAFALAQAANATTGPIRDTDTKERPLPIRPGEFKDGEPQGPFADADSPRSTTMTDVIDPNSSDFQRSPFVTKAYVMDRAGIGADLEKMDKYLGKNETTANAAMKDAYKKFQNQERFQSGEKYQVPTSSATHFLTSKGEQVPMSEDTHPEHPGYKNLEGSSVGFNGFHAIGEDGKRGPRIQNIHEGWWSYDRKDNKTGKRIKVLEKHTIPKNAVHDADLTAQLIQAGVTSRQETMRILKGGVAPNIVLGGKAATRAPRASVAGVAPTVQKQNDRLRHADITSSITEQQQTAATTVVQPPLGSIAATVTAPLAGTGRVATSNVSTPDVPPVIRNMTAEEKSTKASVPNRDDSKGVMSAPNNPIDESPVRPKFTEVKPTVEEK